MWKPVLKTNLTTIRKKGYIIGHKIEAEKNRYLLRIQFVDQNLGTWFLRHNNVNVLKIDYTIKHFEIKCYVCLSNVTDEDYRDQVVQVVGYLPGKKGTHLKFKNQHGRVLSVNPEKVTKIAHESKANNENTEQPKKQSSNSSKPLGDSASINRSN